MYNPDETTLEIADEDPQKAHEESPAEELTLWQIAAKTLIVKAVLIVFGAVSIQVFNNEWLGSWYRVLEIWNRWDALRHTRVEEIGYSSSGEYLADITIFPLFPWLVRAANLFGGETQLNAFIVSGIALVAVCFLLYKIAQMDETETVARNSIWFLLIFPTAYFFHINYTESVFLAVTLASFYMARNGNWKLAGLFGFLSAMGRVNGLLLFPALVVEAFQEYRETKRWNWNWLSILATPLGFGVYLLVNLYVTGNAFGFMEITREKFYKALAPPWTGIMNSFDRIWWDDNPSSVMMISIQELVFIAIGFVAIIFCARLLRWPYTVWMAGNWLLFTSVGFVVSVPRYTLILFPIYILFAKMAQRQNWYMLITVSSLLFFALFAIRFVTGNWAF
jgi:hypothetical protein